ncbi:MAG TPA: amidase family protein, partial [Pirellulales bacterium]|nr:amidase family protein [Pirellulales bacterium]
VREAGEALAATGAHVEPFSVPEIHATLRLYFHLISADGAANLIRTLASDRPDWRVRRLLRMGRMRRPARHVVVSLLRAAGHYRLAELIAASGGTSTDLYWQRTSERGETIRRFTQALDAARLDALVLPPHGLPALVHGSSIDLNPAASYCFLPNLLGMPAGVVPATRVRAGEESDRVVGRDLTDRAARRVEQGSAGLPFGVQVIARHWREDVALAVLRAVERHFRGQPDFPLRPPI